MTICTKHRTQILPGEDCEQCIYEEEFETCPKHGTSVEWMTDCPECLEEEMYKDQSNDI